ncbi:MAG: methyltransferase domain-containing protein [Hyphomicrobiaceae bacterium]
MKYLRRFAGRAAMFVPFTRYRYVGEPACCNLCGSTLRSEVSRYDRRLKRLTTVVCSDCGLLRTDPMPTREELATYYRTEYRLDYQLAAGRPPRDHVCKSSAAAQARADLLSERLVPGARVLDFGAGSGEFLAVAAGRGCKVMGIEPGYDYAAHARVTTGVQVLSQEWEDAVLPDGGFDVITCHHVVEHLRDPLGAIQRMARWLSDNGVVYISVPDMRADGRPAFQRLHFAHVHGFVPTTLTQIAMAAGLEPDARFPQRRTTMVFRKRALGPATSVQDVTRARTVARQFHDMSLHRYFLGGTWVAQVVRQVLRSCGVRPPARRSAGSADRASSGVEILPGE